MILIPGKHLRIVLRVDPNLIQTSLHVVSVFHKGPVTPVLCSVQVLLLPPETNDRHAAAATTTTVSGVRDAAATTTTTNVCDAAHARIGAPSNWMSRAFFPLSSSMQRRV